MTLSVFLFTLLFILTGCDLGPSNIEEGLQSKTLHIGNGTEPKDIDPHIVTGVTEHNIISALLEGLVSEHPKTLEPLPGTAESWEISDNGKIYTFNLRSNARWSNGDPVTAEDFVWSWKRILTPSLGAEYAYQLFTIKNAKAFHNGDISDFKQVGIKAINPYTLQVELNYPTPYFLSLLTHYSTFPVHKPTILTYGKIDDRGTHWTRPGNFVGNGPFTLTEWRLNYRISVEKNPHYWDANIVQLQNIRFYPIDNTHTEERMFRTDVLHVANSIPADKISMYQQQYANRITVNPYLGTYYYRFNVNSGPLKDPRVRQALSKSIDRNIIVDAITKGSQLPAYTFTPPNTKGYTSSTSIKMDIDIAKKLLAEAGYPDGENFPMLELLYNTSDGHRRIAVAIQQMWKTALNIDITLLNQDWKVYLSRVQSQDYDIARAGWIGDYPDPNTFLDMFVTDGGNNQTGWSNPRYDELITLASTQKSQSERYTSFQQAEAILLTESPIIPIYTYTRVQLKHPDVKGWWPNILDHHPYKYVSLKRDEKSGEY